MSNLAKHRTVIFAICLLFLVTAFSGCRRGRTFEKDDSVPTTIESTTAVQQTEPKPPQNEDFLFAGGIKMGMTVKEVQDLLHVDISTGKVDGRKNFAVEFAGVFINYETVKNVQFMFNMETNKLEQIQFQGRTDIDGASTNDAINLFDARFGKHGQHQRKRTNYVWYGNGVYLILTVIDGDSYAITYTEKTYFEQHFKEEVKAYQEAK